MKTKVFKYFILFIFLSSFKSFYKTDKTRDEFTKEEVYNQKEIPVYSFEIIKKYPHSKDSYTEGLVMDGNVLYEGTGLYGKSERMT